MRYSYSSVSTFGNCPYRWKLTYLDKLKTIPDTAPDNALWLGLSIHKGIETGSVEEAIAEYKRHYNIITDANINWIMQIEYQLPKVIDLLPKGGEHELEIKLPNFIGFVDYVCNDVLFDFKFSNNVDGYSKSPQLSIYKYYLEQVRPDLHINHLKYVMIPKIGIRQKKTETIFEFRQRLQEHLNASEIKIVEVDYSLSSVTQFLDCCQVLNTVTEFPKHESSLCTWCCYEPLCKRGQDWIIVDNDQ